MNEPEEDWEPRPSRPVWVVAVAALVVGALVITAIPRFLWPWILVLALAGLLVWNALRSGPSR